MAGFNNALALVRYTELARLISVGAYDGRDPETGAYGEDGIEEEASELELEAMKQGLVFCDNKTNGVEWYSLLPMDPEQLAEFKAATEVEPEFFLHEHGDTPT